MPCRRRAVTSCRNCVARRIKCDRHLPCEACMKKKYECSYEDLASVIKCDRDAFEKIKQLQAENEKLKRLLELSNQDQDETVNDTARLLGGLTFQEGRQRYHGFMPGKNAYRNVEDGLTSMLWKTPSFTSLMNINQRYQLADIAQLLLPSKDIAIILIDRYLRAHPGGFCHIHTPTFESDYLRMWHSNVSCKDVLATTSRPFAFVVALAVFSCAMRSYSSSEDPALQAIERGLGVSRDEYRRLLQKGICDAFRSGLYLENYDLDVVTALMINQAALAWLNSGIMLYMAQSLGLHREPEHLGLTPLECEIRRRVWMYIYIANSWFEGLPPHAGEWNMDSRLPQFNPTLDIGYEGLYQRSIEWSNYMTASVMMHKNIYEAVYSLASQTHSRVAECHQKVKDLEASIPAWLRLNTEIQSADLLFRQLALEGSMARKLLCLFVPLMHKKEFPEAKQEVLKAAHRSMKMYCVFDSRASEMSMYRWMGQLWMFTAPLLSTLIVSMDLVASGSTDNASWSLIDQTLAALIRTPEFENLAEATVICDAVEILCSQRLFQEGFGVALNGHCGFDYGGMQWVEGFLPSQ